MRFLLAIFVLICFIGQGNAQDEEITLTTYYPAPYGFYEDLTVGGNDGYALPSADGTAGQILMTDGAGNASWGPNIFLDVKYSSSNTVSLFNSGPANTKVTLVLPKGTWIVTVSFEARPEHGVEHSGTHFYWFVWQLRGDSLLLGGPIGTGGSFGGAYHADGMWEAFINSQAGTYYTGFSHNKIHTVTSATETIRLRFQGLDHPVSVKNASIVAYRVA